MKKLYILTIVAFAFVLSANAQFDDNFDFYTLGDMADQNPALWSNWSQDPLGAPAENIIVSDVHALSGTQSGFIDVGQGPQDAIMYFDGGDPGLSSGDWSLQFNMYIPTGNEGYFNMQGTLPPAGTPLAGVWNTGDIYFNEGGANPGGVTDTANSDTATFPHDTWFVVSIYFDIDGGPTYQMTVDGTLMNGTPIPFQTDGVLGAIDWFAASAFTNYWIDDVLFVEGPILSTDDFSPDVFSVYPNPVKDILNINTKANVDSVVIYDILGKVVLQDQPDAISPSINMSALSSGAYLVKVTIGDASKTIKVIK